MEHSQFYTGLVAEAYEILASYRAPVDFFAQLVRQFGQPALELACGEGHPLLPLVAQGLQVDGLDSSADMLGRCKHKADELGLTVKLYRAEMQNFTLAQRYRTIYLAGGSFMLLPDIRDAANALTCIYRHLESGGRVVIPLFIPAMESPEQNGVIVRERTRTTDGTTFRIVTKNTRDYEQVRITTFRYELVRGEKVIKAVEREWLLRWYTQEQFRQLLLTAGFTDLTVIRNDLTLSTPEDTAFTFVATYP